MTPTRADQLIALMALAIEVESRPDVPQDIRDWAARILKVSQVEMPYTPPAPPVSGFAEPVAEERE